MTPSATISINEFYSNFPVNSLWPTIRDKVTTYSLYGAVMAMPFSITLCHGCLILFIIFSLAENNWPEKLERLKSTPQLLLLLGIGLMLLAGITYSDNQAAAWFAVEKKAFFFIVPVAIVTSGINSPRLFKILSQVLCLSCFVALAVCYVHAFRQVELFESGKIGPGTVNYLASSDFWNVDTPKRWLFFSYVSLSGAIGMHPTYLALYCAFCCLVLVKEHREATHILYKAGIILLILFFSVSIIFLAARIIIVLLAVVCIVMQLSDFFIRRQKSKNVVLLPVLVIILVVGVILNPVTRYRQVDEIIANGLNVSPDTNYTNSTGIRASLWWLSVKAYLDTNLIIGAGSGDVQQSVKRMSERYQVTNILKSYDPHSQYLHFLLSSGFIGLILFIGYIGIGFVKAWQNRDIIFLNFLILFSAVCATESALELQKGIVFFSIFFSSLSFLGTEAKSVSSSVNFANASH